MSSPENDETSFFRNSPQFDGLENTGEVRHAKKGRGNKKKHQVGGSAPAQAAEAPEAVEQTSKETRDETKPEKVGFKPIKAFLETQIAGIADNKDAVNVLGRYAAKAGLELGKETRPAKIISQIASKLASLRIEQLPFSLEETLGAETQPVPESAVQEAPPEQEEQAVPLDEKKDGPRVEAYLDHYLTNADPNDLQRDAKALGYKFDGDFDPAGYRAYLQPMLMAGKLAVPSEHLDQAFRYKETLANGAKFDAALDKVFDRVKGVSARDRTREINNLIKSLNIDKKKKREEELRDEIKAALLSGNFPEVEAKVLGVVEPAQVVGDQAKSKESDAQPAVAETASVHAERIAREAKARLEQKLRSTDLGALHGILENPKTEDDIFKQAVLRIVEIRRGRNSPEERGKIEGLYNGKHHARIERVGLTAADFGLGAEAGPEVPLKEQLEQRLIGVGRVKQIAVDRNRSWNDQMLAVEHLIGFFEKGLKHATSKAQRDAATEEIEKWKAAKADLEKEKKTAFIEGGNEQETELRVIAMDKNRTAEARLDAIDWLLPYYQKILDTETDDKLLKSAERSLAEFTKLKAEIYASYVEGGSKMSKEQKLEALGFLIPNTQTELAALDPEKDKQSRTRLEARLGDYKTIEMLLTKPPAAIEVVPPAAQSPIQPASAEPTQPPVLDITGADERISASEPGPRVVQSSGFPGAGLSQDASAGPEVQVAPIAAKPEVSDADYLIDLDARLASLSELAFRAATKAELETATRQFSQLEADAADRLNLDKPDEGTRKAIVAMDQTRQLLKQAETRLGSQTIVEANPEGLDAEQARRLEGYMTKWEEAARAIYKKDNPDITEDELKGIINGLRRSKRNIYAKAIKGIK